MFMGLYQVPYVVMKKFGADLGLWQGCSRFTKEKNDYLKTMLSEIPVLVVLLSCACVFIGPMHSSMLIASRTE